MTRSGLPRLRLLLAVVTVAFFAVRAGAGWVGGVAFSRGQRLAGQGSYDEALRMLEWGEVGRKRTAAPWLRALVLEGIWQDRISAGAAPAEVDDLLLRAYREYLTSIARSPASGWFWINLGDLYHQCERLDRYSNPVPLGLIREDPWALVGKPGRVAVGLTRFGIEREPTVYDFHDRLALMLFEYRVDHLGLEAVRQAARVQPIYLRHPFQQWADDFPEIQVAFAEGSREALGRTPFTPPVVHLLELGKLEWIRGNPESAEADLRASLEVPGKRINRAETRYYLGLVLTAQERWQEAEEELRATEELHEAFLAPALAARARLAELTDRPEDALRLLGRVRRLEPRHLGHALAFARIARRVGRAEAAHAALRWAAVAHPDDPLPLEMLVEGHLAEGERALAREQLAELELRFPDWPAVSRLRARLDEGR